VSIRQGANTIAERWARSGPGAQKRGSTVRRTACRTGKDALKRGVCRLRRCLEGVVFSVLVEILKPRTGPKERETAVWILDSTYRDGCVDLWVKDGGTVQRVRTSYDPPFFARFHDPGRVPRNDRSPRGSVRGRGVHHPHGLSGGPRLLPCMPAGPWRKRSNGRHSTVSISLQRGRTEGPAVHGRRRHRPVHRGRARTGFRRWQITGLSLMEIRVQGDLGQSAQGFEIAAEYAGESCRFAGTIHDVLDDFSGYLAACDPGYDPHALTVTRW